MMAAKRATQASFIAQPAPRYAYRARYYPEPPADWPAPKEACHICQLQQWPASWKWTGYEWMCTRKHNE